MACRAGTATDRQSSAAVAYCPMRLTRAYGRLRWRRCHLAEAEEGGLDAACFITRPIRSHQVPSLLNLYSALQTSPCHVEGLDRYSLLMAVLFAHGCMGMGPAAATTGAPDPAKLSTVCSRCAKRCCAAADCACLCWRTAAQCCLWCCNKTSTAGALLPLVLPASAPASARPGSGGSCGASCCSVAAASSGTAGSGGSLDVGSGCSRGARALG